ncbi:ATP-binding cassette domain-containing protein [Sphingomonas sp. ST-64]|uniref:ATP-binding cassette domain-containing protein n=1 Tax=Sphingomonas plantiphila TaxID=3163295 RepID=A0ABW8YJB3_9SPHN
MSRASDIAARLGIGRRAGLGLPMLLAAIAASSAVALLAVSGWFLTGAAIAGTTGAAAVAAFNYLLPSAAIRALAIARTAARYGERLTSHGAALHAMAALRARLFGVLAAADTRTAPDLSGGEASARLIDDIEALEDLVVRRSALPGALIGGAVAAGFIALAGWVAALAFVLLAAIGLIAATGIARRLTRAPARAAAVARGALRDRYVELAAARPEIIAYGLSNRVEAALAPRLAALDAARLALARAEARVNGGIAAWNVFVAVAVTLLAAAGPALTALAALAAYAGGEAMGASVRSALRHAALREGLERLDALAAITPPRDAQGTGAPARLRIGALDLGPGARLAITGASGSGKTSLIESLAGLRRTSLSLEVDGSALDRLPALALARQFALAPQSPQLIAGTIGDNLRLARPGVDADAMWGALDIACLAERVRAMPQGLDTPIGEGGGTLSGGEQKRLSLARALLAGRPWFLADEPTEGLDSATEDQLLTRLDTWLTRTGTGLILVSHRPAPHGLCELSVQCPLET